MPITKLGQNETKVEVQDNSNSEIEKAEVAVEPTMETAPLNPASGTETANMRLEHVDVKSIGVGYHPRKSLGDIKGLQASIKRDGLQEPLLVYEVEPNQYAVIDGYRRLEAIKEFGWETVSCLIKTGIDDSEAAHLSYVKNTERNSLNPIEVAFHIRAMQERFGYTLDELGLKGYGTAPTISRKLKLLELSGSIQKQIQRGKLTSAHGLALVKLPTEEEQKKMAKRISDNDLTAKRAERQIERYLSKGKRKEKVKKQVPPSEIPGVYIKDSRDMSELPDKSVHLIMSSPPYNIGMEFEKGVPFDEHVEMVRGVLKESSRVLVPGGIMALNVGDIHFFKGINGNAKDVQIKLMGPIYQNYLRSRKIFLTDIIVWEKQTPWRKRLNIGYTEKTIHTSYRISADYEPVYIYRKQGQREIPPDDIVLKSRLTKEQWIAWVPDVWKITAVRDQSEHPSIYPDELCLRLIKMFSYEGDTVLDPWLGSGTTVKVARELNRNGIGYEKEPQYKALIMKKLGITPEEPTPEFFTNMKDYSESMLENQSVASEVDVDTPGPDDTNQKIAQEELGTSPPA